MGFRDNGIFAQIGDGGRGPGANAYPAFIIYFSQTDGECINFDVSVKILFLIKLKGGGPRAFYLSFLFTI